MRTIQFDISNNDGKTTKRRNNRKIPPTLLVKKNKKKQNIEFFALYRERNKGCDCGSFTDYIHNERATQWALCGEMLR